MHESRKVWGTHAVRQRLRQHCRGCGRPCGGAHPQHGPAHRRSRAHAAVKQSPCAPPTPAAFALPLARVPLACSPASCRHPPCVQPCLCCSRLYCRRLTAPLLPRNRRGLGCRQRSAHGRGTGEGGAHRMVRGSMWEALGWPGRACSCQHIPSLQQQRRRRRRRRRLTAKLVYLEAMVMPRSRSNWLLSITRSSLFRVDKEGEGQRARDVSGFRVAVDTEVVVGGSGTERRTLLTPRFVVGPSPGPRWHRGEGGGQSVNML